MINTARLLSPLVGALLTITANSSFANPSPQLPEWEHMAGTEAYIPNKVTFGLHDNHVLSAADFGSRRLMLFDAPGDSNGERSRRVLPASNIGAIELATARDGDAVFSAAQFATGITTERFTEFARYDATDGSLENMLVPTWTNSFAPPGTLTSRIATDSEGAILTAAVWDGSSVSLAQIDGQTGTLFTGVSFVAGSLTALEVSESGDRIALVAGTNLRIYDAQLNLLHEETFALTPNSFSLAGDGHRFAVGFTSHVDIFGEQAFWSQQQTVIQGSQWLAAEVDLSHDGESLAIGWWNVATGFDVRFELRGGPALQVFFEREELGAGTGLQNLPQAVAITPDGKRAAFGCWGDGDSDPEVLLVDRDQAVPVLEVDLPGSVRALDLDRSGTRIVVAFKETHANIVGFRGSIRLYDTGERDLNLVEVPTISNGLKISYRPLAVPHAAYLALGKRNAFPTPLAGGSMLALDRTAIRVIALNSNASPAESTLPLATYPNLRGRELSIQMLFRTRGGLRASKSVIDFTLL